MQEKEGSKVDRSKRKRKVDATVGSANVYRCTGCQATKEISYALFHGKTRHSRVSACT